MNKQGRKTANTFIGIPAERQSSTVRYDPYWTLQSSVRISRLAFDPAGEKKKSKRMTPILNTRPEVCRASLPKPGVCGPCFMAPTCPPLCFSQALSPSPSPSPSLSLSPSLSPSLPLYLPLSPSSGSALPRSLTWGHDRKAKNVNTLP